jgi:coenzyme F420-reducing hydrogenase beta subunit
MENPICPKELCTGCSACYNVCPVKCIDMQIDKEGFYFPIINLENCIDCRKCENVCPILNHADFNNNNNPGVYASWHKDEKIRYESSSGGVFSALAASVIEENGIVYGAVYDSRMKVKHISINKKADIKKLRGSKYVQSYIGDTFTEIKEYLNAGKVVLFSGTPCQVAGLKNFIGTDHSNLITCDLLCHGVPSPELFNKYIKYIEKKMREEVIDFKFRDKQNGWESNSRVAILKSGKSKVMKNKKDSFIYAFENFFSLRSACYSCLYTKVERVGDITLGDFWGIGEIAKFNHTKKNGISLVLVNSIKGEKLLYISRKYLFLEKRTLEEAKYKRLKLIKPHSRPEIRKNFYKDYNMLSYEELANKYLIDKGLKGIVKKIIPNNWIYKIHRMFRN